MFDTKKIIILFISVVFLANCSLLKNNPYSFYQTFINPDASKYNDIESEESKKPSLESVPDNVDLDE